MDAVFDAVGGRHWLRSARCLRPGGQLVAYGSQHEVGERIPWREARRAQEILDQGAIQGKLVLTFP